MTPKAPFTSALTTMHFMKKGWATSVPTVTAAFSCQIGAQVRQLNKLGVCDFSVPTVPGGPKSSAGCWLSLLEELLILWVSETRSDVGHGDLSKAGLELLMFPQC